MQPALLVRLRPAGPWRYGPSDGGQDRTDTLFRSDRLFAALSAAAKQLGFDEEWLAATAGQSAPSLAISSLFPFQGDTLFAIPPAKFWPPPAPLVTSPSPVFLSKVRWAAARFVPLTLIETILRGQNVLADQWAVDPESECLLRRDRPSSTPFRPISRSGAAVDRLTRTSSTPFTTAGIEFEPGAGLWGVVRFADEAAQSLWSARLQGMLRLLVDTGFGGRRSSGWGHAHAPEFQEGVWPQILFPKLPRDNAADQSNEYWLLSLFSPAAEDSVNWAEGVYDVLERSTAGGSRLRFISEGSVLSAHTAPIGRAIDIANGNGKRRVYRSGIALALKLPEWQVPETPEQEPGQPVEKPSEPEAIEPRPCDTPAPELEAAREPERTPEEESTSGEKAAAERETAGEPEATPEQKSSPEPEHSAEPQPHPEIPSEPQPDIPEPEIPSESSPDVPVESPQHSDISPEISVTQPEEPVSEMPEEPEEPSNEI